MKALITAFALTTAIPYAASACSDIFVNKGGYHIVARTLDFLVNIGFQDKVGYVGDQNTTDIIIDTDKIPSKQVATWINKYGFVGRAAFKGGKLMDGMNTQGLAVAALYLPGSKYPSYDSKNTKPALGIYDIG